MSLKRHPNVVFVGIDTLDDIMNNSYNELFVSGGCIISHEFVLDPDFITRGRSIGQPGVSKPGGEENQSENVAPLKSSFCSQID